jgi:ATP-binding protein involved in chromosome partitioning
LVEGDWGDAELILVDLPPGTGDVQLSLIQKSRPAGAVIVSTPQDLSLIDATRAIDLFGKTSVRYWASSRIWPGISVRIAARPAIPSGRAARKRPQPSYACRSWAAPLSTSLREASDAGRRQPPETDRQPKHLRPSPANCWPNWRKFPPRSLLAAHSSGFHKCR